MHHACVYSCINCIMSLPVKKEALNPFPFLLFVELICSNTHREDPLTGAPYKRLVLPNSPICVGKRHHQLRL